MFLNGRIIFLALLLLLITGCGTKDAKNVNITIDPASAAADPFDRSNNVSDIVFLAIDNDNMDTKIIFPSNCDQSNENLGKNCGFKINDNISLKLCFDESCSASGSSVYIPADHKVVLLFCARNSAGSVVIEGSSGPFTNNPNQLPLDVIIKVSLGSSVCTTYGIEYTK